MVAGGGAGGATGVLEAAISRCPASGPAHRLPSPPKANVSWGATVSSIAVLTTREADRTEPARRGDAVHAAAGGLPGAAGALQWAGRYQCGDRHCQPFSAAGPGGDRLFSQYAGLAQRSVG